MKIKSLLFLTLALAGTLMLDTDLQARGGGGGGHGGGGHGGGGHGGHGGYGHGGHGWGRGGYGWGYGAAGLGVGLGVGLAASSPYYDGCVYPYCDPY